VSSVLDLPTGAAIVVTLVASFVLAVIASLLVPAGLRAPPEPAPAH